MCFSVRISARVFTTSQGLARAPFTSSVASEFVVWLTDRPFAATCSSFYRGKDKSPFVLMVGKCCRYALLDATPRLRQILPGATLPRRAWVRLYHLRTGVGRFCSCLYKWGMASSAACECGAEEQTVHHVVLQCPIHRPPHGLHGLTAVDDETIEWLLNICPEI